MFLKSLFLEKLKTHENYANCDKNELSLMNKVVAY